MAQLATQAADKITPRSLRTMYSRAETTVSCTSRSPTTWASLCMPYFESYYEWIFFGHPPATVAANITHLSNRGHVSVMQVSRSIGLPRMCLQQCMWIQSPILSENGKRLVAATGPQRSFRMQYYPIECKLAPFSPGAGVEPIRSIRGNT